MTEHGGSLAETRGENLLLLVLFTLYTLSFLDRQVIALMVEPIKQDLEITDFQFSLVQGLAFSIFYTLFGVPLGWAADHFDRRKLIFSGTVIWGTMTMACGFANSFIQLFLARVGVGVGEASLTPAAYSLLADKMPPGKQAWAMSIYASASIFGAGIALLAGGVLLVALESSGGLSLPLLGALKSWQVVFLICGLPGVFVAGLLFLFREPARLGLKDKTGSRGIDATLSFLRRNRRLFLFHFAGFSCFSVVAFGYAAWGPAFLIRVHGLSAQESGIILGGMLVVFGPLSAILVGGLVSRLERQGIVDAPLRVYFLIAIGIIPVTLFAYLSSSFALSIFMVGVLIFTVSVFSGPATLALKRVVPNEMRGQITALFILTISLVGLGIGPSLIAACTDFVFGEDGAVGKSLALVSFFAAVLAAVMLRLSFRPYADAVALADQWCVDGGNANRSTIEQ